ncbi:MAG: protein phosphatase 2C domain-containing protein [Bifidobacteriaceae bacterium]|jgi:protein phosphatase|nr:protein phosphatase 2C domain-containing protein [Bifidobacteriaceae bacterium]
MEARLATTISAAMTDVGRARTVNEDSVIAHAPVFIVADGMGGHEAGDAASRIVAQEMSQLVGLEPVTVEAVKERIQAARERIQALDTDVDRAAGTTISGVVVVNQNGQPYWLVVNLGDSRTYRFNGNVLEQLSVDHSEVQEMVESGRISAEQARHHPRRHVVTRALGAGVRCEPDYWLVPIEERDRILVCSDGLTGEVPDQRIATLLREHPDPGEATDALVAEALRSGGNDNVSVIVVDASQVAGAADPTVPIDRVSIPDEDTIPRPLILPGGLPK